MDDEMEMGGEFDGDYITAAEEYLGEVPIGNPHSHLTVDDQGRGELGVVADHFGEPGATPGAPPPAPEFDPTQFTPLDPVQEYELNQQAAAERYQESVYETADRHIQTAAEGFNVPAEQIQERVFDVLGESANDAVELLVNRGYSLQQAQQQVAENTSAQLWPIWAEATREAAQRIRGEQVAAAASALTGYDRPGASS
jgi:hypothetical protein